MSEATKGMGPRLIGQEEYDRQKSAPVIAKNLGFGARMLTDSPDAVQPPAVPEGVRSLSAPEQPPRFMGRRQTDQPPHTTDEHRDVTGPLGQPVPPEEPQAPVNPPVDPMAKGFSASEVATLCREAPARAQELFEAELARPDGMRLIALGAIRAAAISEKNEVLAGQAQEQMVVIRAAREAV